MTATAIIDSPPLRDRGGASTAVAPQNTRFEPSLPWEPPWQDESEVAAEILDQIPKSVIFDAEILLAEQPADVASRPAVVALVAFEEFLRRWEAGERIDREAFVRRFPHAMSKVCDAIRLFGGLNSSVDELIDPQHADWPRAGEEFVGFELVRLLGAGLLSRVFLAKDLDHGRRPVVVKVCINGRREAWTLGRLEHPNIVPVNYSRVCRDSDLIAICMPWLGRATLAEVANELAPAGVPKRAAALLASIDRLNARLVADFNIPPPLNSGIARMPGGFVNAVVGIVAELAGALEFIHSQGFFHCDVKPANVLMTPSGRPMLLDFNISHDAEPEKGAIGGTPEYMAPEQLEVARFDGGSELPSGPRVDVFSLGVLAYELLTARRPFDRAVFNDPAAKPPEVAAQVLKLQRQGLTPLRRLNPHVDRTVAGIVESCIALDPAARPESAKALSDALKACLKPAHRARRGVDLHRRKAIFAGAAFLAGGGAFAQHLITRPPYAERQHLLGLEAVRRGEHQTAVECFTKAIEADPSHVNARFHRGRAHQAMENLPGAFADLSTAARQTNDGRAYAAVGYCLLLTDHEFRSAITNFRAAIDRGFTNAALLNDLGYAYIRIGDDDAAIQVLIEALALGDEFKMNVCLNLANSHLNRINKRLSTKMDATTALEDAAAYFLSSNVDRGPGEYHFMVAWILGQASQQLNSRDNALLQEAVSHCHEARQQGVAEGKLQRLEKSLIRIGGRIRSSSGSGSTRDERSIERKPRIVDPIAVLDAPVVLSTPHPHRKRG